jgi:hypothetical protein
MLIGNRLVGRGLVLGLCGLMLAATSVFAFSRYARYSIVRLSGVDETGSASDELGGNAVAKTYKDASTGIIYQIAQCGVMNELGIARSFSDRGLPITDPTNGATLTATSDLEVVTKNNLQAVTVSTFLWRAAGVRVYDPRFATDTTTTD